MEFDKFSSVKLLISVSVFSVFLSYSSLLNSFVSAVSLKSFSQSIDKNYMFLLFNGLLVFIVKNSGLIGKYPPGIVRQNDENDPKNSNTSGVKPHKQASFRREQQVVSGDDVEEKAIESSEHLSKEEEKEKEASIGEEEEEASIGEEEEEKEKEASIGEEEEGVIIEEEGIELLSTEELNKKCEEFIRRMRRQIVYSRFRNY